MPFTPEQVAAMSAQLDAVREQAREVDEHLREALMKRATADNPDRAGDPNRRIPRWRKRR